MSRTMQQIADEIRAHGHNLIKIADQMAAKAESESPPEPEPEISFTDLRGRLADKSRAGYTEQIRQIILKHGAEKLSELDKSEYAAVLAETEALT